MGRHTCCFKQKLRKGLWSPEEDEKLLQHITKYGHGCWSSVPKLAGLQRCGKSCRLRWINYLRPDLKRGAFSDQEENLIIQLHAELGNRWSQIAAQLPGRTDNEIKNLWNSSIKKKLREKGIDPNTHMPLLEADGEKSGTPSSSPDHAPQLSGPRNPAAGYFAVNYAPDNRTPPASLTTEAGANSIFWFGQSSKAYDASTGFDCGSISSVLPPVSSSILSNSTGIRPMASLLQVTSSSACGGGINGFHYWESGTSSNNSGTTGNSSNELQTGTNFIHNPVFPWREYAANREPEHLPLEGELDELKWSDFLQSTTMPPFPSPLAIHQSNGQNQLVLDEFGNWQQMHRPPLPLPFPLAQLQQDHQQQNPLLPVQNQDMYSKDLQTISAAFGQI